MVPLGGPGAPEGRSMATARRITRSCRAFGFRHLSPPRMLRVSSACILVFGIVQSCRLELGTIGTECC